MAADAAYNLGLGLVVILLALHAGLLLVLGARVLLLSRRNDAHARIALFAAAAGLLGELALLRGILRPGGSPAPTLLLLGVAGGLALLLRRAWRSGPSGGLARQALFAPALGLVLLAVLLLR